MKTKYSKLAFYASITLTIGLFVLVSFTNSSKQKTAYIKVSEVYDEFTMKKELESKLTNVEQSRKTVLDSLELHLKLFSNKINNLKKADEKSIYLFNSQKQEYLIKKKQFEEDNQTLLQQYTEQITKQLNQYVQDYGKEYNYSYIYGAEGSGALMYADNSMDISKEMIKYINNKYKGLKQ